MAKSPAAKKAPARKARAAPPATTPSSVKKQAVIIVHGIGEQRPLETIRGFVETVYQRDPALTPDDDPRLIVEERGPEKINRVWIVPDAVAGSNELRRITTPEHIDNRRTDFYEFYWADLTNNTPFEMITAWLKGLLLRSPFRIPNDIRIWWSWLILWVLTILLATGGMLIAYPTAGPFESWVAGFASFMRWKANELGFALALLSAIVLAVRAFRTEPVRKIKLFLPVLLLVLSAAILVLAPLAVFADPRFWAAVITAAAGGLIAGIIVPYVGDIVRYVRATPLTVAAREAIRNRGLELLREIHKKNEYSRIVLVGHSLGCFVAYDLLQLFWHERGPDPKKDWVMTPRVQAALHAVDAHVQSLNPMGSHGPAFDADAYHRSQSELHEALVADGQGWLISDFVTMGSPLVHSAFLTADDGVELERLLGERMLSASPPRPDLPNNSMLYGARDAAYPHHAAVFAAVHWSNLYDFARFPIFGDVVSGKVPEDQFGPGVINHGIAIRKSRIPILGRLFTHTVYWTNTTGNWAQPPEHIVKLRQALNLMGR